MLKIFFFSMKQKTTNTENGKKKINKHWKAHKNKSRFDFSWEDLYFQRNRSRKSLDLSSQSGFV